MNKLPKICKECQFYSRIEGREFCTPEKPKYGHTLINGTDTPKINKNICRFILDFK